MRHRHGLRKLNRTSSHRLAMLRNMTNSLFTARGDQDHAAEGQGAAPRRRAAHHARQGADASRIAALAFDRLRDRDVVTKLFNELGPRYQARPGGYLRILKFGFRQGDAAPMALVELVDRPDRGCRPRTAESSTIIRLANRKSRAPRPAFCCALRLRRVGSAYSIMAAAIHRRMADTILVTGGAGYVGSHVVVELARAGYAPVVLDDFSNSTPAVLPRLQALAGRPVPSVNADVRDVVALRAVFHDHPIVAVVHCAGLKAVGESEERPLAYYDVNVGGAIALARGDGRGRASRRWCSVRRRRCTASPTTCR